MCDERGSQVSITLDAYLDGKEWAHIDKDSYPVKKAGREVDMLTEQVPARARARALSPSP